MTISQEISSQNKKSVLRCPVCKGKLHSQEDILFCTKCLIEYQQQDGIPNLMPPYLDAKLSNMVKGWNHLSYDYNLLTSRTPKEHLNAIDSPLLECCQPGNKVLEVGCGTARLESPVVARGCEYFGIDPSLQLLGQSVQGNHGNLFRAVGEELPFENESFDVIIGGYCSFRYIQHEKGLAECARVLKPDGLLAFTLWNNWALFGADILRWLKSLIRYRLWLELKFRTEECFDLVCPWTEIWTLQDYGFSVDAILSTKRFRFFRWLFRNKPYWKGPVGALFGHDLIFLCRKK